MKKILFFISFLMSVYQTSAQTIYPNFDIDLKQLTFIVSQGTAEQQCGDVASRSSDQKYSNDFDTAFFNGAVSILKTMYKQDSLATNQLVDLADWGRLMMDCNKGVNITKEKLNSFLYQSTEKYKISVEYKLLSDNYDSLIIGKVGIKIVKTPYPKNKKIIIKDSFYLCEI